MALTSLQGGGRGVSFDDYFKQALNFDISKLEAIIRGQDHSMPIVAAMAAYEVKKPMATAAAGQQATQQLQQAQPTVRQEMEQEMDKSGMIPDMAMLQQQRMGPQPPVLPEQAGVGALPAPNMQGMSMAHGGIIAFEDGGYVPGYAGNEESLVDEYYGMPFGGRSGSEEYWQRPVMPYGEQMRNVGESLKRGAKRLFSIPDTEVDKEEKKKKDEKKEKEKVTGTKTPAELKASSRDLDAILASRPAPMGDVPPPARNPRTGAPAPAPAPAPAGEAGIAGALKARDALVSGEDKEIREKLGQYEKDVATGIEGLRKIREEGKPAGKAYEKYEAQLMKEEEAAKGKEERNLQMALVNAGLAIAGGTSQYALENIGKGAMVGTKQYMDGIDKLEAAAKKRQEAAAMIENARRAEERGDWEKKNEFEARAVEMQMGAKKNSIDALSKITGENKRAATDIFNTMETNATRERMAREQNKTELQKAAMLKEAYGARQMNPNVAIDNAKARLDSWLKTAEGKTAGLTPGAVDAKYQEYLRDAFREMGMQPPGGAASAGGAGSNVFDYTPGKGLVPVR